MVTATTVIKYNSNDNSPDSLVMAHFFICYLLFIYRIVVAVQQLVYLGANAIVHCS